jgi:radical SAM superfamily enzyme YgiQ (UPF0313 family)
MASAPIGLCYVADAAAEAGHQVSLLDLCFRNNRSRELARAVRLLSPDLIGVSIRNIDNVNLLHPVSYVPDAVATVHAVRRLTGVPLVLGGSGASLAPMRMLQVTGADYVVVSDGETAFVKLVERLEHGASPDGVPGVGMLVNGAFRFTPPSLCGFGAQRVNIPRWVDIAPYKNMRSGYPVLSKRGCVRNCVYCTYKLQVYEGNRVRLRDPAEVVDELEEAVLKSGVNSFEFVDPLLNAPTDHLTRVLELIVNRPWKARFAATAMSPKGLDKPLADLLWRAGFRSFWLTPESGSDAMLQAYCKGLTVEDVIKSVEALRGTRFNVAWTFMIGGPGETNATLRETLDFHGKYLASRIRPPWFTVSYFFGVRLYPGTRLWDIAEAEGFVDADTDPLEQTWYLSRDLDLGQAVKQVLRMAATSPELLSGMDERFLRLSRLWALLERITDVPALHRRLVYRANQLLRRPVLWLGYNPAKIAETIRERAARRPQARPHAHG